LGIGRLIPEFIVIGTAIQQVYDQTPASAAGLIGGAESRVLDGVPYRLDGDVIVAVGGEAVETSEDLIRELARAYRPGDLVELEIQRGDERMSVEVRVGERPDTAPRGPDG
ncbi:MAG: PDZ domain-containing protein, partial [Gaiellales bacterium]